MKNNFWSHPRSDRFEMITRPRGVGSAGVPEGTSRKPATNQRRERSNVALPARRIRRTTPSSSYSPS
jgi:hypothetical protein